jgi:hypothetical protein
MSPVSRIKDSFLLGVISGLLALILFYSSLSGIRYLSVRCLNTELILRHPSLEFITILINIILFRFITVNFDKEKTGKGFLLSTIVVSFVYFYFFLMDKQK